MLEDNSASCQARGLHWWRLSVVFSIAFTHLRECLKELVDLSCCQSHGAALRCRMKSRSDVGHAEGTMSSDRGLDIAYNWISLVI